MKPTLEIKAPLAISSQARRLILSTTHRLPFQTDLTFRHISQSQDSPMRVTALVPAGMNGSTGGRTPTDCWLLPVHDMMSRADAREQVLAPLSRAAHIAHGKTPWSATGKYTVAASREETLAWIREAIGANRTIALDIESDKNPSTVHASRHSILCLGLCDGPRTLIVPESLFDEGLWPELCDLLENAATAAHNGLFDGAVIGFVCRGKNQPLKIRHDTMLAHYALWPVGANDDEHASGGTARRVHGLKILGMLYTGCQNWGLTQEQYQNMRSLSLEELYKYNAFDVQHTHNLLREYARQFRLSPDQLKVYRDVLMPASNHLMWQVGFGITVDVPYVLKDLIPGMQADVDQATRDLIHVVEQILPGHTWTKIAPAKLLPEEEKGTARFNPGSPNQVREVLTAKGIRLPVDRKSKSGLGSTSKLVLTNLLETTHPGDPVLTGLLHRRKQEKLLGTYARPLSERSHAEHPYSGLRVFPSYNLHKVVTGRLSSDGPNIQNQPKHYLLRKAYKRMHEGRMLIQIDFSQAELRVMAALSRDRYLINIFADDNADIFDMLLPGAFPQYDFTTMPGDQKSKLRRDLKAIIYGLMFSRGAAAIAQQMKQPVEYAQAIMDGFLANAFKANAWRREITRMVAAGERLTSRMGRYLLHEPIRDNRHLAEVTRQALSFLPQSGSSDSCLLAAIKVGDVIRDNGLDWQITALIHDAINLDVPVEDAEWAAGLVSDLMVETAESWFPEVHFATDWSLGHDWADLMLESKHVEDRPGCIDCGGCKKDLSGPGLLTLRTAMDAKMMPEMTVAA